MNLNKNQLNNVYDFCKLNNIEDVNKFMVDCFSQGFNIKKYGLIGDETSVKEVVVEKMVEVPVEVIKEVEVEKIIEKKIPVEVIKEVEKIVEVPVEKIVYIQDKKDGEVVSNLDNIHDKKDEIISELKIKIEGFENQSGQGNKEKMLQQTLVKLKKELSLKNEKIKELEKINEQLKIDNQPKGAVYLKGSNLQD